MDESAGSRRLAVLARQLEAAPASGSPAVQRAGAAAGSSAYASATGQPSSYARVHGEVSRSPAQWRPIRSVAKEELVDVKYEKAAGEGIAKVLAPAGAAGVAGAGRALTRPPPPADHHQPAGEAQCLQAQDGARDVAVLLRRARRPLHRRHHPHRCAAVCPPAAQPGPPPPGRPASRPACLGAPWLSRPAPRPAAAGEGPLAFCSGGDQSVRGKGGYVGSDGIPRLSVLDLQVCCGGWQLAQLAAGQPAGSWLACREPPDGGLCHEAASARPQPAPVAGARRHPAAGPDSTPACRRRRAAAAQMQIRRLPKPVVAMVAGYAVGGGHILHMVCDLTVRGGGSPSEAPGARRRSGAAPGPRAAPRRRHPAAEWPVARAAQAALPALPAPCRR
jgi:hypothetical protein